MLFWAMSAGFVRGVGFIPKSLAPRWLLSGWGYLVALVLGGEAVSQGNGRLGFAAAGVLVVFIAALQLLRKRTTRRTAALAALEAK